MAAGLSAILTKAFKAETAVARRRIVKFGSTDNYVVQAAAAADLVFGVSVQDIDAAAGEGCDVHLAGVVEVEFGAAVTRGQRLMADANGRAIPAAAVAGTNVSTIGIAMASGIANDVGYVLLRAGTFQG